MMLKPAATLATKAPSTDACVRTRKLLPSLSEDSEVAAAAALLFDGNVELGEVIARGASASVHAAALNDGCTSRWVVKRLGKTSGDQAARLASEVALLCAAGLHPNLVGLTGWYVDESSALCLLLERCAGGTLSSLLRSRQGGAAEGAFPTDVVLSWFVQLLLALHHLHGRRILHRDLKPDNVLLSANQRVVRLTDLGISKRLESCSDQLLASCSGTPGYMPPEALACRPATTAGDVWALGCVLYEMTTRQPAFTAHGLPQLAIKVMRGAYTPLPSWTAPELRQLVSLMLRPDPDDRPSTGALLQLAPVRGMLQQLVALAAAGTQQPCMTDADLCSVLKVQPIELRQVQGSQPAPESQDEEQVQVQHQDQPGEQEPHWQQQQRPPASSGSELAEALEGVVTAVRRLQPRKPPRRSSTAKCTSAQSASHTPLGAPTSEKPPRRRTSGNVHQNVCDAACCPGVAGKGSITVNSGSAQTAAAAAAALQSMPAPAAMPSTRRVTPHAWASTAAWDVEQRRLAEARYAARALEQRLAREQARSRRKSANPAGGAASAPVTPRPPEERSEERSGNAPGALGCDPEAAAAQDAALLLLLRQLRAASGAGAREASGPEGVYQQPGRLDGGDQESGDSDGSLSGEVGEMQQHHTGDSGDSERTSALAAAAGRAWGLVLSAMEGREPLSTSSSHAGNGGDAPHGDTQESQWDVRHDSITSYQYQQQQQQDFAGAGPTAALEARLEAALANGDAAGASAAADRLLWLAAAGRSCDGGQRSGDAISCSPTSATDALAATLADEAAAAAAALRDERAAEATVQLLNGLVGGLVAAAMTAPEPASLPPPDSVIPHPALAQLSSVRRAGAATMQRAASAPLRPRPAAIGGVKSIVARPLPDLPSGVGGGTATAGVVVRPSGAVGTPAADSALTRLRDVGLMPVAGERPKSSRQTSSSRHAS